MKQPSLMVINRNHWMDETTTELLTQTNEISLSKFHHESTQFPSFFTPTSSVVTGAATTSSSTANGGQQQQQLERQFSSSSTDNLSRLNGSSNQSTPKRSISCSSSTNPLNDFLKPHSILSQNNSSESDDDDDEQSKKEEINLYPLSNQVGGHTRLLLLNEKTVIKPLIIRELEFYQNIPGSEFQQFVPKYKGKCNVCSVVMQQIRQECDPNTPLWRNNSFIDQAHEACEMRRGDILRKMCKTHNSRDKAESSTASRVRFLFCLGHNVILFLSSIRGQRELGKF